MHNWYTRRSLISTGNNQTALTLSRVKFKYFVSQLKSASLTPNLWPRVKAKACSNWLVFPRMSSLARPVTFGFFCSRDEPHSLIFEQSVLTNANTRKIVILSVQFKVWPSCCPKLAVVRNNAGRLIIIMGDAGRFRTLLTAARHKLTTWREKISDMNMDCRTNKLDFCAWS